MQNCASIHLIGKTQFSNMGDCFLGRFLARELRRLGQVAVAGKDLPEGYSNFLETAPGSLLPVARLGLYRKALEATRLGPSLIVLNAGHYYSSGNSIDTLSSLANLSLLRLISMAGVGIFRFGASIGPFTATGVRIERAKARATRFYGLRDSISMDYAIRNLFENPKPSPDLGFLAADDPIFSQSCSGIRDSITFSFRKDTLGDNGHREASNRLLSSLRSAVKYGMSAGMKIALVAQVREDEAFMKEIASELHIDPNVVTFDSPTVEDAQRVIDVYKTSRFILSNRLHALLFAAAAGAIPVPVTSFRTHQKIVGIFRDADLLNLGLNLDSNMDSNLHLESLLKQEDSVRKGVDDLFSRRKNEASRVIHTAVSEFIGRASVL